MVLSIGLARAALGQGGEGADDAAALTVPLTLAAQQAWGWSSGDGASHSQYIHLSGQAAVLQGAEGLRGGEAVVRIVPLAGDDEPLYQVEVYAEHDVRDTREGGRASPRRRAVFRAPKVAVETYGPEGMRSLAKPPPYYGILQRSGLVGPPRRTRPDGPAPNRASAAPALTSTAPDPAMPGPTAPASAARQPKVDPMLVRAQAVGVAPDAPAPIATSGTVADAQPPAAEFPAPPVASDEGLAGPPTPAPAPIATSRSELDPLPPARPARSPAPASAPAPVPTSRTETAPPSRSAARGPVALEENEDVDARPPAIDLPPIEGEETPDGMPGVGVPNLAPIEEDQVPKIEALPHTEGPETSPEGAGPEVETGPDGKPRRGEPSFILPVLPGTQRTTSIRSRTGRPLDFRGLGTLPDGTEVYYVRGGVNIVTRIDKGGVGTMDIEADEAVIWRGPSREKGKSVQGPNGEWIDDASKQPMELYLEGNVVVRQDQRKLAGKGDQRTLRAKQVYYNYLTDRMLAREAEIDLFMPGLVQPFKLRSPQIEQFHELIKQADGTFRPSEHPKIRADNTTMTGSRFPNPGYQIAQKSVDLTRSSRPSIDPLSGEQKANPGDPNPPEDLVWDFDARQNVYWMGPVPVFYWPRVVAEIDDQQPPLRQIFFRTNNYFGQQLLTDWNGFRFIPGLKKPKWIDLWNIDFDYLSARTKQFPAVGTELGWFGKDLLRDLSDPYHQVKGAPETITKQYYGYFDIWGLRDFGTDVLGTGYAIVTNGPPGSGKAGLTRSSVPAFQKFRGRVDFRHNQRFLPDDEDHQFQDLRLQTEAAYFSDRYFLEEYYKRLHDIGLDQETLGYGIYQRDNVTYDLWVEANPMNWQTETQWLPRFDYYRLGDSLLSDWFTYYQHSGLDYATINTDIMVNNPNLFAFMPYDPISNTSGTFSSGRFYTNHEIDLPLKFYNAVRFVPYVQGSLVGWTDQLGGGPLGHSPSGRMGRAWGAAGLRAETTLYKRYPYINSDILNVHGLNNKISFFADARSAWSNIRLNQLAIQDDLDDNTYEMVRRYLAITTFAGGVLPMPYDPRHLILRQMISPITGTTDVQAAIQTVQLGVHQRLQTKRGPKGKRRIVDYMTMDATGTYFPNAQRDNFGTPWGQTQYNYQWYLGDRTSIVSQGWFEFWKLVGSSPLPTSQFPYSLNNGTYNPNGLNIITTGISLQRPPRSNIYLGYVIIDTGPIHTSALNASISYWLSPKWYGTFATSYDFGNATDLGTMFTFTRIGADYLTTLGLSVDPQRMSYQFAVQITPRLSPAFRMGSNAATNTFDTRFAPTE